MRLLHHVLASPSAVSPFPPEWGSPPDRPEWLEDGLLSVLYSDVGDFYTHYGPTPHNPGWSPTERRSTIWKIQDTASEPTPCPAALMNELELANLLRRDDDLIRWELTQEDTSTARWTFLPGDGQMDFLIKRFTGSRSWVAEARSEASFGAYLPGDSLRYAAWTFEMRPEPSRLIICRIRLGSEKGAEESFRTLVQAALSCARQIGVKQVEVWNLSDTLQKIASDFGAVTMERDDHWPCVAWYGPPDEAHEWVNNEK